MTKGTRIALAAVAVFVAMIIGAVIVGIASYVSAANSGNSYERQIEAQFEQNKNVYSNYTQTIAEVAQVPTMMRDDLKEVVVKAIESRYGNDGSKAVMQWIQEQNPNLDPALYRKIQQLIESGRREFQNSQTKLIDIKRSYETNLGTVWTGFWMRLAGYPKIDLSKYMVVITENTEQTFKTGREAAPVKLR